MDSIENMSYICLLLLVIFIMYFYSRFVNIESRIAKLEKYSTTDNIEKFSNTCTDISGNITLPRDIIIPPNGTFWTYGMGKFRQQDGNPITIASIKDGKMNGWMINTYPDQNFIGFRHNTTNNYPPTGISWSELLFKIDGNGNVYAKGQFYPNHTFVDSPNVYADGIITPPHVF